jgi:hypothetical protein
MVSCEKRTSAQHTLYGHTCTLNGQQGCRDQVPAVHVHRSVHASACASHALAPICLNHHPSSGGVLYDTMLSWLQVRSIWYDNWTQCDAAFGAELKAKVQESLKKM